MKTIHFCLTMRLLIKSPLTTTDKYKDDQTIILWQRSATSSNAINVLNTVTIQVEENEEALTLKRMQVRVLENMFNAETQKNKTNHQPSQANTLHMHMNKSTTFQTHCNENKHI